MTQKIFFYIALVLLMAVPMALAWLLPVKLMVGIIATIQLLTIIVVGTTAQQLNRRDNDKESN